MKICASLRGPKNSRICADRMRQKKVITILLIFIIMVYDGLYFEKDRGGHGPTVYLCASVNAPSFEHS